MPTTVCSLTLHRNGLAVVPLTQLRRLARERSHQQHEAPSATRNKAKSILEADFILLGRVLRFAAPRTHAKGTAR